MNQSVKNILIDQIIPASLILLAIFVRPFIPEMEIAQTTVFAYLPLLLLTIALLISWKFNQIESFFLCLIFAIAYIGILEIHLPESIETSPHTAMPYVSIIAVLIPLNLLIFKVLRVSSLYSVASAFHLISISAQGYGVFWLANNTYPPLLHVVNFQIWPEAAFPFIENLPQVAVLLFSLLVLTQIAFVIIKQSPLQSTLLGAFIMTLITCFLADKEFSFFIGFSAAAIMVIMATIQTSYNMAFIDTLTQLPSRRAMENELKGLGRRYSIAMLDIDHFKNLNDTYGHDVGDQVLRMVAKHIRRVGGGGRPARYGGEEFVVIFPNRTMIDATPFLEIVRANIENASFALRDNNRPKKIPKPRKKRTTPANEVSVTISIGLAERNRTQKTTSEVLKLADDALYKAKKQGRNQLCQSSQ